MSRIEAIPCELDIALTLLRQFEAEGPLPEFAGSQHWTRAAARVHGPEHLVPVLFRAASDTPVGVAVFATGETDWRTGTPGQRCLRWPFQQFGYHFAPTFVRTAGDEREDWLDAVRQQFGDHVLDLQHSAPVRVVPESLESTDGPSTWSVILTGGFTEWQQQLEGEHRRDFEYYRRRIAKNGGEWVDSDPRADLDFALEQCFDLHERRVADRDSASAYLTEDGRAFLRALVDVDPQSVRITRLKIGDRVVGASLAFVHGSTYRCFMPGWDPAVRKFDLGRQVIYHQILEEFERGLTGIDLLGGDFAYKREFGLLPNPTVDLTTRPTGTAAARKRLVEGARSLYRRIRRS